MNRLFTRTLLLVLAGLFIWLARWAEAHQPSSSQTAGAAVARHPATLGNSLRPQATAP